MRERKFKSMHAWGGEIILSETCTHIRISWKGSTWSRCEINYEDKSSTISTLFFFWFEASLSPDIYCSILLCFAYCFELESFQFHSLTGRSLFERCLVQWGCSEDDSAPQDVERFCSHILALGILQPFSDCIREPPTGSDVTDKPIFNVWPSSFCLFHILSCTTSQNHNF